MLPALPTQASMTLAAHRTSLQGQEKARAAAPLIGFFQARLSREFI